MVLAYTNFLRAWAIDGYEDRRQLIARRLVHLLIRQLQSRSDTEDAPPVTIFLSHSKPDIKSKPHVVKAPLAYLTANLPENVWYAEGDISTGSCFEREIEKDVTDTVLLAIETDSYWSRAWCQKEVLLAKRKRRPIVVVDAEQT